MSRPRDLGVHRVSAPAPDGEHDAVPVVGRGVLPKPEGSRLSAHFDWELLQWLGSSDVRQVVVQQFSEHMVVALAVERLHEQRQVNVHLTFVLPLDMLLLLDVAPQLAKRVLASIDWFQHQLAAALTLLAQAGLLVSSETLGRAIEADQMPTSENMQGHVRFSTHVVVRLVSWAAFPAFSTSGVEPPTSAPQSCDTPTPLRSFQGQVLEASPPVESSDGLYLTQTLLLRRHLDTPNPGLHAPVKLVLSDELCGRFQAGSVVHGVGTPTLHQSRARGGKGHVRIHVNHMRLFTPAPVLQPCAKASVEQQMVTWWSERPPFVDSIASAWQLTQSMLDSFGAHLAPTGSLSLAKLVLLLSLAGKPLSILCQSTSLGNAEPLPSHLFHYAARLLAPPQPWIVREVAALAPALESAPTEAVILVQLTDSPRKKEAEQLLDGRPGRTLWTLCPLPGPRASTSVRQHSQLLQGAVNVVVQFCDPINDEFDSAMADVLLQDVTSSESCGQPANDLQGALALAFRSPDRVAEYLERARSLDAELDQDARDFLQQAFLKTRKQSDAQYSMSSIATLVALAKAHAQLHLRAQVRRVDVVVGMVVMEESAAARLSRLERSGRLVRERTAVLGYRSRDLCALNLECDPGASVSDAFARLSARRW